MENMSKRVKKPGYMGRALAAWVIYNVLVVFTVSLIIWVAGEYVDRWFVMIPVLAGVMITQFGIFSETIGPVIKEWITQEEVVSGAERPSWERGES